MVLALQSWSPPNWSLHCNWPESSAQTSPTITILSWDLGPHARRVWSFCWWWSCHFSTCGLIQRRCVARVGSIQVECLPCSKCSQNHSRSNFTKDAFSKILKLKRDNFKDFRKTTTGLVSKFFHGDPRGLLCPKSLAIFTAAFWNCGLLHRKVPG